MLQYPFHGPGSLFSYPEAGSPDPQSGIFLTSAEPQPLSFSLRFSLPDGNNDPYSSTSHRCWTDWLVNVQKWLWGWKVPIIITIMLSKRHLLPLKGSCRVVTGTSLECSVSRRWNVYVPAKKNAPQRRASWNLVICFLKDLTKLPPWSGTGQLG